MMNTTVHKASTDPSVKGWTQSFSFDAASEKEQMLFEKVVIYLASTDPFQGVTSAEKARTVASKIKVGITSSQLLTLGKLKEIVGEVLETTEGTLLLTVALVRQDTLYLVASEDTQIDIIRNLTSTNLLKPEKQHLLSASGYIQNGDLLLIGTVFSFDKVSGDRIARTLKESSLSVALSTAKEEYKNSDDIAGIVVLSFSKIESAPGSLKPIKKVIPQPRSTFDQENSKPPDSSLVKSQRKLFPSFPIKIEGGFQDYETVRKKKRTLFVGIILLVLLIISSFFGFQKKQRQEYFLSYEAELTSAVQLFDESISLLTINSERSRELYLESKQKTESLQSQGVADERLTELMQKITDNKGRILGEYATTSEVFVDLSLQANGFSGERLFQEGDRLYILDTDPARIISVDIETQRTQVIAGPGQMEKPIDFAVYDRQAYVLENDGVYLASEDRKKVSTLDAKSSMHLSAYTGNLYILDAEQKQILRLTRNSPTSYSDPSGWLSDGVELSVGDPVSISIDGTIWVLGRDGNINRFGLGNQITFRVQGLEPNLKEPRYLWVHEDLDSVYILDSGNSRVVVLDAEGKFVGQYSDTLFASAQALAVSLDESKMIVLVGEKLYSFALTHKK